jgi:putative ABC transport system permease protein
VLRLWAFLRSARAEAELTRELAAHLLLLEDRYRADGMSADEARLAARRAFGGQIEQMKERQRDARGFRFLDEGWLDIKLGARMLVKYPGLTLVAVFALSLAIAGGAAYLEFLHDMTRPTLPGKDGDRVVGIYNWDVAQSTADHQALPDFASWRNQLRSIEDLGAFVGLERNLVTDDGRSEPVSGVQISASAFRVMRTPPLLGRPLVQADEEPSAPLVAVIGESLWRARFAADAGIIGATIRLGHDRHTVVGVMPEAFGFPVNQTLWVPLRLDGASPRHGQGPPIRMFGRLAPGVTADQAEAELVSLAAGSGGTLDPGRQLRPQVEPWVTSLWSSTPDGQLQLVILYSANLFFIGLLAVAGANVATLVFARTATRESEITVRTALGASRGRIIAQLFAEALVLCSIAATVGLGIASLALTWGKDQWLAGTAGRARPPFWWNDQLAPETVFYAAALALLAAAIVGVVPGLKATGPEMQARLKHAAAGGSTMKFGGVWTGVIIGQVALTVIFLLSAVSLGWNLYASGYQGGGVTFAANQFLSARLEADRTAMDVADADVARQRPSLDVNYRELERRLLDEPGVTGVTYASAFPGMKHGEFILELQDPTIPPPPGVDLLWVRTTHVADDFFETFDVPVVAGRSFTAADVDFDRRVAVVDETFVATVLGGRNPIGQLVRERNLDEGASGPAKADPTPQPWYEIVGVVRDISTRAIKTSEDAVLYRPAKPSTAAPLLMAVRVAGDAGLIGPRVRTLAAATDPTMRRHEVMSLDQMDDANQVAFRFFLWVIAIVSGVALVLAAAGVYALLSFTVVRRTREIGIRAAVGANQRRILAGIFSRAFSQVGLGIMAGSIPGTLLVAFGAPEVARGSGPAIGLTAFLGVAIFMLVVTGIACVIPARRALRVQPTDALRADA